MSPSMRRFAGIGAAGIVALVGMIFVSEARPAAAAASLPEDVEAAMNTISSGRIRAHLRFLSSDLLEGRGTGARGGDLAAQYVSTYLQLSALWPGGAGNGYLQRVPLVGVTTMPGSTLTFAGAGGATPPAITYKEDFVLWTETQQPDVESEGDLIFAGYGIEAPEVGWDDYKGQDVAGKVLLMLVNDPPSEDPSHFGGKGLTYYGRWTYKFEIAARKGAIGAIIIHTDESAGYGWGVVRGGWSGEQSFTELDPRAPAPLKQAAWVTESAARDLIQSAGQDYDALRAAAATAGFAPVSLGLKAKARVLSEIRKIDTANVIAYVPGTDEALKDQAVIVTAHYDHLGIGEPDADGDTIYNGAYDNASGVATMLDLARAFRLATVKPRRSVVFIATAAEEQGLRGSTYYATNPTFPAGKIAAIFNVDGVSVLGISKDMTFLGAERSSLKRFVEEAGEKFGFRVTPDAHPEQGFFYRSDHFPFAKIGVPAISVKHGYDFEGKEPGWGEAQWQEYNKTHYHKPSDEYQPGWDLNGAQLTGQIVFYLAYRASMEDGMPVWNPGDEFEAARKQALEASGSAAATP